MPSPTQVHGHTDGKAEPRDASGLPNATYSHFFGRDGLVLGFKEETKRLSEGPKDTQ